LFPWAPEAQIASDLATIERLYINKGPEYLLRYLKASEEAVLNKVLNVKNYKPNFSKVSVGLDYMG
jgi:hypothetical protein